MPTSRVLAFAVPIGGPKKARFRWGAVLAFSLIVAAPGQAAASVATTAGNATPNFTESSGCGPFGLSGPISPGFLIGERLYGPVGDFFGRDYAQVFGSIVEWADPSGRIFRVHSRMLPALAQVAANVAASGVEYQVTSGASFVWRNVGGKRNMSFHATGSALDLNPAANPYSSSGSLITNLPAAYVQAWRDAGFCWGGDWIDQKDTMHFSWRGPAHAAGATGRQAPYPPLTGPAGFTDQVYDVSTAIPATPMLLYGMADRNGDGSDDLYGLQSVEGRIRVLIAASKNDFSTLGVRRDSAAPVADKLTLADGDGDGRADLWTFTNSGGMVLAEMYSNSSRFAERTQSHLTGVPWSAGTELGLAVFDWSDYLPDLFAIDRGSGLVKVYSASSGFTDVIHQSTVPFSLGTDHLILADRDVDGFPDLWAVANGSQAAIRVVPYRSDSGYGGEYQTLISGMEIAATDHVLPGDWDGDGRVDLYRMRENRISVWLGGAPDRPVDQLKVWFTPSPQTPFDAGPDCQGACASVGAVGTGGVWRLASAFEWGALNKRFYYGNPGDTPFMGDWNGDGIDTPGLYRRSDGYVYLRNSNTQGNADISYWFGNPGDIAIVGDFDGDGRDTVSIYRPREARFYIINRLGSGDSGLGSADYFFDFGNVGDKPFVGDLDGDGIDEVALHRESTGLVYYRQTLTSGVADHQFIFGNPGDVMFAADWNGDGVDTVGLFRPSMARWYIRLSNTQGPADHMLSYGSSALRLIPVVGVVGDLGSGAQELCSDCAAPGQ